MSDHVATDAQPTFDEAVAVLRGVASRGRLAPVTGAQARAAWEQVKTHGEVPDDVGAQLGAIMRAMRHGRAPEDAEAMAVSALSADLSDEAQALVSLELATVRMAMGTRPADLDTLVRDVLAHSDAHLRAGRVARAGEMVVLVNEAVFHRELNGEVEDSPLVFDTQRFLAPLHESLTYQALSAPVGSMADRIPAPPAPSSTTPGAPAATARPAPPRPSGLRALLPPDTARGRLARRLLGRPQPKGRVATPASATPEPWPTGSPRILALSAGNLHFTSGLLADLEAGGAAVRIVETRRSGYPRRGHADMATDRLTEAAGGTLPALPAAASAELAAADIVFVDWFDVAAQWAALHVPRSTRLIIRVHSLEALSAQPHLADYSRISDLIFVGGHIHDLFMQAVPAARTVRRVHVVPNEMRLERFGLPKTDAAARTIAMIGWGQMVKDPLWALDLLARLRADDPAWRLLLIGRDFADSQITSGYRYRDAFRKRLVEDDVRDGVVDVGYTTDLPEVLREAGYILSCSRREGGPVGVTEGAASGAVPIVRDWPMAVPFGGARRVFPAEWVVDDPAHAAERIRSLDGAAREQAGQQAREYALQHFDWPVVAPRYRSIFLE